MDSPASKLAGVVISAVIWATTTTTAAATGEEAKQTIMIMAAGMEAPEVMETGEALRRAEQRVSMEGGTMTTAMAARTRAAAMVKVGMGIIGQRMGTVVMVMGAEDGIMVGTAIVGVDIRPTTGMVATGTATVEETGTITAMGISELRQIAGGEHV